MTLPAPVQKLVNKISAEGEKTSRFFSEMPEELWEQQLYADGAEWSVHEVLAHIVDSEGSLLRFFEHIVARGKGVSEDFDIDRHNAHAVEKLRATPRQELLAMFGQRRANMVSFVCELTEADLLLEGRHPFLGQAALEEMLRLFYLHVNLHVRDIRQLMR